MEEVNPFEYCKYKCLTSSGSVQYENNYRSEYHYCYDLNYATVTLKSGNSDRLNIDMDGKDNTAVDVYIRNILHD